MKIIATVLACLMCFGCATEDRMVVFEWPDVPLAEGERILSVTAIFKSAQAVYWQRRPAEWIISMSDLEKRSADFSGFMALGGTPLKSASELPMVTLRPSVAATQIVAETSILIRTYPEGIAPDRMVIVSITNKIPQQIVGGDRVNPPPQR